MFIYLFFRNIIYYFYLSRNKIHVLYYLIYFQFRYARKFVLGFNFVCSHRQLRYAEACILFVSDFWVLIIPPRSARSSGRSVRIDFCSRRFPFLPVWEDLDPNFWNCWQSSKKVGGKFWNFGQKRGRVQLFLIHSRSDQYSPPSPEPSLDRKSVV